MTVGVDIGALGDKKLQRRLNRFKLVAQKKIFRKALRRAVKPIVIKAKQLVGVKTGKLRKSIRIKPMKGGKDRVGVMIQTGSREKLNITEKYYYPAALEYGTKKLKRQSFLKEATLREEAQVFKKLAEEINLGIEAEFKKS